MLVWVTHACSQLTRYQSQPNWLPKICTMLISILVYEYRTTVGVWSSGMILASGVRGREFDSRNTPLLFYVLLHSGPPFALEFGDPSANMQQAWLCFCMSLVFFYIYTFIQVLFVVLE